MQAARLPEGAYQPSREGAGKGCGFCISVNEEVEGATDDAGQGLSSKMEDSSCLFIYSSMGNV